MSMTRHVKKVTLTSKKNWWMVELDEEDGTATPPSNQLPITEETLVNERPYPSFISNAFSSRIHESNVREPNPSVPVYTPPNNPLAIFSFPTPTTYSAPPNPTQNLAPFASGSASELFKCVVKKPNVVQVEINDEMQTNAQDVITQFLAELRVYTTVTRHRNIAAFLGCLENVGMVLECIDGRTLWDVIKERPGFTRGKKIEFHNQLLDGLTHLHSFGLSHGDLSLLNVQVTYSSDTIKLLDFGRSVSTDSTYASPFEDISQPPAAPPPSRPPITSRFASKEPYSPLSPTIPPPPPQQQQKQVEQIHPGTRPFAAPEVLRGECQDPRLADAYSFGMILVCLDRCELVDVKPWVQRKDALPQGFLDGLLVFGERCEQYLRPWDGGRRRLLKEDMMDVDVQMAQ
ncbi:kinase-like protein [Laetiporus sulphureus 93-53]|uniref:Kinase-like protein n=1 Tax=Laetiporus sulphureus 93-53 TaxID=1314785 RepID=A0A165GT09_9APHY|nr:kinase-like protein [Laetiporus sulphureus 93-53]KZT10771.1 kinase-like protein [Laetiporus sulphureus 93-53]